MGPDVSGLEVFGFSLVPPLPDASHREAIERSLRMMELADGLGIDGWFIAEHHAQGHMSLSAAPSVLLGAASQRTTRLRLGTMASVLPFNHPARLAEELATLDLLTGGRLEAGVGRGHLRAEQMMFGVDRVQATGMFDEAIDVVMRLLRGETVDYRSDWWGGEAAELVPLPARQIPMWLTAVSDESIDKAARLGFSCATALLPRAVADQRMATYRDAWQRIRPNEPCGRFAITATVAVAGSEEEAVAATAQEIVRRQEHFAKAITDAPSDADPTYEGHKGTYSAFVGTGYASMIDDGLLIAGDVERCREQVRAIEERGIDTLICTFHGPAGDGAWAEESMTRFARDVLGRS